MFPLPPLIAAALVALAALLATYLSRPSWLDAALVTARRALPIGWLLMGVVLGPLLGVIDRPLVEALTPVVACAIGWLVAGAAARLAGPPGGPGRDAWSTGDVGGFFAAVLVPAALLYGAMRLLPPTIAPVWKPVWPVLAVLSASLALAAAPRAGAATAWSLAVSAGALVALFPHARRSDLTPIGLWVGFAIGGPFIGVLIARRLGRQAKTRAAATITALCLTAGIGLASGTSPYFSCGLLGFALAKWAPGYERLGDELAPTEQTVGALLWFAAGLDVGGRVPAVYIAALLLALWPALRRRFAAAGPTGRHTQGLALALSFALTAERALGSESVALVTAAALALVTASLIPARTPAPGGHPLTSATPPAEVTA